MKNVSFQLTIGGEPGEHCGQSQQILVLFVLCKYRLYFPIVLGVQGSLQSQTFWRNKHQDSHRIQSGELRNRFLTFGIKTCLISSLLTAAAIWRAKLSVYIPFLLTGTGVEMYFTSWRHYRERTWSPRWVNQSWPEFKRTDTHCVLSKSLCTVK